MKIAILLPNLSAGGAEPVGSLLMTHWSKGHEVIYLNYLPDASSFFYKLPKPVDIVCLDLMKKSSSFISLFYTAVRRIWNIHRVLIQKQPDILLCFMTENNVIGTIAGRFSGVPIVISERTHPQFNVLPKVYQMARRLVYSFATRLVVQTQDIAEWCFRHLQLKAEVMANPIDLEALKLTPKRERTVKEWEQKIIISVGRLGPEKGFDLLIEAFARVSSVAPEWPLYILGQGAEHDALMAQIKRLGMEQRIILNGLVSDPQSWIKMSDLFVLASRYEGFPNVLLEAMACGRPMIATDSPGASAELLGFGANGWLVPNEKVFALAHALNEAMHSAEKRDHYAAAASQSLAAFALPQVASNWITVFRSILSERKHD